MEDAATGLFEVTDMRVYHGTALWHRLGREGRLLGNPPGAACAKPSS